MFARLHLGPAVPLRCFATRVCAGFPSPADDFLEDDVDVARLVAGNPLATFLWTAEGECMIAAGIFDGDVLVVDRSLSAKHGDVVIAIVDGQPSVKRMVRDIDGGFALEIENPAMAPFAAAANTEVSIWGVVTWTLRRHPGADR